MHDRRPGVFECSKGSARALVAGVLFLGACTSTTAVPTGDDGGVVDGGSVPGGDLRTAGEGGATEAGGGSGDGSSLPAGDGGAAPGTDARRRDGAAGGDRGTVAPGSCAQTTPASPGTSGRQLYVAPTGNDSTGDGSQQKPLRTLPAAGSRAKPGDTIYLRGGTYAGTSWRFTAVGTAAQPIVVLPYAGEKVVLSGRGASIAENDAILTIASSSHVVFDGFELTESTGRGLSVYESDHVAIRRCVIHAIKFRALGGAGSDVAFEGNEVYDAATANTSGSYGGGGWPGCVQLARRKDGSRSTSMSFVNNHIHDCWGECLIPSFVDGLVVRGNRVHDCYSVNVYVGHVRRAVIDRNIVYTTTAKYDRVDNGQTATGIHLALEYYSGAPAVPLEEIVISNNLVLGTGSGIGYWSDPQNKSPTNTYKNVQLLYNVVMGAKGVAMRFRPVASGATAPSGCVAQNNIFYAGQNGSTLEVGNPTGWSFASNDFPNGVPQLASAPGNFAADPQFVSPVKGGPAEGFKVKSSSPCRGAGSPSSAAGSDYFCTARSASKPTVGLHEL
ncbi:MAG: right-handed parallel beta-helix repeat-containing protein [Deltaproteobacteria bacterium]|nr:right-handed parallel beta-helix repeat-containing protein [Deltaproteobacteria bacterium]